MRSRKAALKFCRFAVVLAGLVLALPITASLSAERRVALVVANAQYQFADALPGAAANATVMAEALRKAGFEVTVSRDLGQRGFRTAISRFANLLAASDLGVFYYTGYTLASGQQNFIIPVDAKGASEFDLLLEAEEVAPLLRSIQGASNRSIVLIDSLGPNPIAARIAASMGSNAGSLKPVLGESAPLPRMLIAYSHQPATAVAQSPQEPGPFASAFAQEAVKPGVEISDGMAEVSRAVQTATNGRQRPWLQGNLGTSLVMLAVPVSPPAAPPIPPPALARDDARVPTPEAEPVAEIIVDPFDKPLVTKRGVNFRESPNGRVLRVVPGETAVTATGKAKGSNWIRIKIGDEEGFVHNDFLRDPDPAPVVAETTQKPQQDRLSQSPQTGPEGSGRTADNNVAQMRQAAALLERPQANSRVLKDLSEGLPVWVIDRDTVRPWVKVREILGTEGYVPSASVEAPRGGQDTSTAAQPKTTTAAILPAPEPEPERKESVFPDDGIPSPFEDLFPRLIPPVLAAVKSALSAADRATAKATGTATLADEAARKAIEAQGRARQASAQSLQRANDRFRMVRLDNGDVYEGEWLGADRNGYGIYRYASGDRYEGEWRKNEMSGYGVHYLANGSRFEGQYKTSHQDGYGVLNFDGGHVYRGEFRQNDIQGYGAIVYRSGDRFEGTFTHNKADGYGVLTFKNGVRYLGAFQAGQQWGPGVSIFPDGGAMQQGTWRGNRISG